MAKYKGILHNLFVTVLIGISFTVHAQKQWTLEECINTAFKNNISVKQKELTKESTRADYQQSRLNALPSLNGQATNNWNIGFAINPVTNTTERNATFRSNNFGLSSSMVLFNGFQNTNTIKMQSSNLRAVEQDVASTKNNIALSVANAYLQVMLNEEVLESRRLQVQTTQTQVIKQEKLYELGGTNKSKLLQLKAQLSNEELQIVTAENQLMQSYLTLWQTMNILPDTSNKISKPDINADTIQGEIRTTEEIYTNFLKISPDMKAAQQRTRSAQLNRAVALGGRSPRLTLNGNLSTFYTTQNQRGSGDVTLVSIPIGQDVNGLPVTSLVPRYSSSEVVPFKNQIDQNFGRSGGFTLSLPIFNGNQVNTNIQKSRISEMNAELTEQQTRNDVYRNVTQAHLDFKLAQKKYEANSENLESNKESFSLADKQYALGAIGTYEYVSIKNSYLQSQTNFIQAKYELIFRRKVLDFYLGKPLY